MSEENVAMQLDYDKLKYNYQNTFCFKAPFARGEFTNEIDKRIYELILEDVRMENAFLRANGVFHLKFVARRRYRGPRKAPGMAFRRNAQSICLKQYANAVSVYVYLERTN